VRKLKAKGKEDPAAAAKDVKEKRSGKAVGVTPAGDKVEEEEEEEGTDSSDGPDDEEEGEEEEEEEEGQKGQFARRKLASNSWRYEKAAAVGDSLLGMFAAFAIYMMRELANRFHVQTPPHRHGRRRGRGKRRRRRSTRTTLRSRWRGRAGSGLTRRRRRSAAAPSTRRF